MIPCTLVYAASVQIHKRYVFANLRFCSQARLSSDQMDAFMQEFVDSVKEVFPQLFVQFEDFSTDNAFRYLNMFRSRYRVFNDDVKSILFLFGINLVSDISCVTRYKGQVKIFVLVAKDVSLPIISGAVVLSGFINAAKISSKAAGTRLEDQRILFFGAGSAGIGVAKQLVSFFTFLGQSEEEAKSKIYVNTFFSCDCDF